MHDSTDCPPARRHARREPRAAATAAGTTLSEWIRFAIRQQTALATAMRARAEEDSGPRLYTDEQEDALVAARRRRAATAFTDKTSDQR